MNRKSFWSLHLHVLINKKWLIITDKLLIFWIPHRILTLLSIFDRGCLYFRSYFLNRRFSDFESFLRHLIFNINFFYPLLKLIYKCLNLLLIQTSRCLGSYNFLHSLRPFNILSYCLIFLTEFFIFLLFKAFSKHHLLHFLLVFLFLLI